MGGRVASNNAQGARPHDRTFPAGTSRDEVGMEGGRSERMQLGTRAKCETGCGSRTSHLELRTLTSPPHTSPHPRITARPPAAGHAAPLPLHPRMSEPSTPSDTMITAEQDGCGAASSLGSFAMTRCPSSCRRMEVVHKLPRVQLCRYRPLTVCTYLPLAPACEDVHARTSDQWHIDPNPPIGDLWRHLHLYVSGTTTVWQSRNHIPIKPENPIKPEVVTRATTTTTTSMTLTCLSQDATSSSGI
jgi:hypothetical protein